MKIKNVVGFSYRDDGYDPLKEETSQGCCVISLAVLALITLTAILLPTYLIFK